MAVEHKTRHGVHLIKKKSYLVLPAKNPIDADANKSGSSQLFDHVFIFQGVKVVFQVLHEQILAVVYERS